MTKLPLENILVVDLSTGPAGGIASMILSDFGARVLRPKADENHVAAPMFLRGKKTLSQTEIDAQIGNTDVMIVTNPDEPFRYESLCERYPTLIYCEITAMGENSSLPLYEPVIAAKAGRMKTLEGIHPEPGPVFAAVPVATHACSQNVVTGILAAVLERDRSGKGQKIHTSLLQGLMPYDMAGSLSMQIREQRGLPPTTTRMDPFAIMPPLNYHPVQCQDGKWIQLGNLLPHLFANFIRLVGLTEFVAAECYQGPAHKWSDEDREILREEILRTMQTRPAETWMKLFIDDGGVASHQYQTAETALNDRDMTENGHVVTLANIRQLGPVANLTKTPAQPGRIKTHTKQHFHAATGTENYAPLEGVTVLELATIIAAPMGASFLADLGARVIKVEPIGGDPFRNMGGGGLGAYRVNQGKESIGLNLKTEAGRLIVRQLAAKADILIHNYRPGVPERLGIGYEELSALNRRLIYIASNGYGPAGPGAYRPSTHPIPGAALGGAGYQAGGLPEAVLEMPELREACRRLMRANEVNPDPNTAMVVATTALLGLMARRQIGTGQQIFIDMFGANAYANFDDFIAYDGKPQRPDLDDKLKGTSPFSRLYACDSGWIFLGIRHKDAWYRFCELTGIDLFLQFDNPDSTLTENLAKLFTQKPALEWESLLSDQDIGCVRADQFNNAEFFFNETKLPDSQWMQLVESEALGEYYRHKAMIDFSRSVLPIKAAVKGGADSESLMLEMGYADSEIQGLFEKNVLWRDSDIEN